MAIRESTKRKYTNVAHRLKQLLHEPKEIDASQFCRENVVAAYFVRDMERAGFVEKDQDVYAWLDMPINNFTMQRVFDLAEARSKSARQRYAGQKARMNTPAANDTQQSLDLVQSKEPEPAAPTPSSVLMYTRADYEELERRVSALEQLLIRRGVA